jgi:hypothetical protein
VLLTQDAAADPQLVARIEKRVREGGSIVITSGLLKVLEPRGIGRIAELRHTGRVTLVKDFQGRPYGPVESIEQPLLVPQVQYITNDTWELASAIAGDNGFPLLTDSPYGRGHLYVLAIPDNFADLYRLPATVLNTVRQTLAGALPVRLAGPSKVALYVYDNDTFVLESFRDEPVSVEVLTGDAVQSIRNLESEESIVRSQPPPAGPRAGPPESRFRIELPPHSFAGFGWK